MATKVARRSHYLLAGMVQSYRKRGQTKTEGENPVTTVEPKKPRRKKLRR